MEKPTNNNCTSLKFQNFQRSSKIVLPKLYCICIKNRYEPKLFLEIRKWFTSCKEQLRPISPGSCEFQCKLWRDQGTVKTLREAQVPSACMCTVGDQENQLLRQTTQGLSCCSRFCTQLRCQEFGRAAERSTAEPPSSDGGWPPWWLRSEIRPDAGRPEHRDCWQVGTRTSEHWSMWTSGVPRWVCSELQARFPLGYGDWEVRLWCLPDGQWVDSKELMKGFILIHNRLTK